MNMKIKEKESLKNMNDAELQSSLRDMEKKYFQLKFTRRASPLENPIQIRFLRRKIAFVKTILSQRKKSVPQSGK
ncbi:MAG: 50S ribosomal protein L29 [Elusimicrobia bacterium CG08_land_8_20_14_0_20_51_18]|nr:MAG: 50S ribosomal protein L29 [Elusimicrobia bacterium CG08_land_8_20_14_0_20_51_18]